MKQNTSDLKGLFAYVNGKIVPAKSASVSIFDRGLVLGDGLFESLRARYGVPEFLNLHYQRLAKSARRLHLHLPVSETKLNSWIATLCRRSHLDDAVVRITLTRGRYFGGLSIDPNIPPSLFITVIPVSGLPASIYSQGVKIAVSRINKAAASGLDPRIKSTNYLANIFAKAEAEKKGCYEAILLGSKGEIAELSTASFFGVRDGMVITPPIETGILPGITRQVLLREMRRRKIPCLESVIFPQELFHYSEAFLCSSIRGPMPITRVDGKKIGDGKVGPVFKKLRQIYTEASGSRE